MNNATDEDYLRQEAVADMAASVRIFKVGEHIEMCHEREMPGYWTEKELNKAHDVMHIMRKDWSHDH